MAGISYWESILIAHFVLSHKKERYEALLKGRKKRAQFLDLLNHNFAYDPSTKFEPKGYAQTSGSLLKALDSLGVDSNCYVVADQSEYDGREIKLGTAVEEFWSSQWGMLLICPPKPIVVYKQEAPSDFVFLRRNS